MELKTMLRGMLLLAMGLALLAPAPARAEAGQSSASPAERDVRALLARWLDAQNRGDFDSYQALYAARFAGIRRSGPRTVTFDREGWMRDRARMFRQPMQVEVTDATPTRSATGWELTFTQTFTQGTFRDRGVKALLLVDEGGRGLRIAREEMRSSEPAPGGSKVVIADKLARGCFGWSRLGPQVFCVTGNTFQVGADDPSDRWAVEVLGGGDTIGLPSSGGQTQGIDVPLGPALRATLEARLREANAQPLAAARKLQPGEAFAWSGAVLGWRQQQTRAGGENRAPQYRDRVELRCAGNTRTTLVDESGPAQSAEVDVIPVAGKLVLEYHASLADEGDYGSMVSAQLVDEDPCKASGGSPAAAGR